MEEAIEIEDVRIPIFVQPAEKVRPVLFAAMTGYTVKAVEKKIEDGVWLEGHEYERAPDGRILIILEGFYKWAGNQRKKV